MLSLSATVPRAVAVSPVGPREARHARTASWAEGPKVARTNRNPNHQQARAATIYKRGKAYWYNFRWTINNADGTKESFRIVKSARAKNKTMLRTLKTSTGAHCGLDRFILDDPWPKPTTSAPPIFRAFSKEFLQYAKTHTKLGTITFYEGCLERLLTFAAIADAPLDAITGEQASRYARHRGKWRRIRSSL